MPFNQWKTLSAALVTLALPFSIHANPRPDHPTIIVGMDTHATYIAKGPAIQGVPQAELRAAALLELSTAHACGSNEVYLTPDSVGVPNESFGQLLAEVQQLIDDETPLLITLSACDGKRAFFEKVRACTPEECGKLTASLVDGKLYLDEDYAPTSKGQASYFLKMPMAYDSNRKAWKAKVFYVDAKTLRRDYFVNAKDFVSGRPVLASKTYYSSGKLGQSYQNDANGQRQGEAITYSESGVVIKRANYLNDELEGWQTTYHDNGKEADAYNWHQGKRVDGEYLEHDEDGALIGRISYRNDVPDGPAMSYYPSGKLKDSSTFVAGKAQGPSTSYFENGAVRSTRNNVDSSPEGWVISYYADGKVEEKQFFEQQVQRSYATWNDQGIQTVQWQWDEQHREQGDFKKWYENGQLQDHRIYKDGKLQGPAITWYENGQMNTSVDYVEGREQGVMRLWKQDGSPNGECRYEAGVRQGECTRPESPAPTAS
ncbi:toxin-antitoxin system YwqK family antitoxin [Pseudomonas sp. ADAK2]|uniref:toxin-antitoxin system YwqK family antitoxin n=1 Tax=unclassified Pseudomonas TaxID=196821 RepID=UPI001463B767|nr:MULTISPECIES: toxin-antitoxin system YwqK family antitoxin [unclassified Pseudomonas]QJI42004.1 toxin-antitoxin system YwqK family antitoxin [Pseudomonas sp. ADAK7]QJI48307.1 toxin-antitoxin system YwqK family antitoxin [Pseudomonas sp. ADAK2]